MSSSDDLLAAEFETNRARLRAVAHRMLGSSAEDAVQETWLRLSRAGGDSADNLADHRDQPGLPGHAALPHVPPRGAAGGRTARGRGPGTGGPAVSASQDPPLAHGLG